MQTVNAEAKLISDNQISVDDKIYECSSIITATGAKPKDFPNLRFDHEFVLSSDDILNLDTLPKSILIIGSGAIGIEWARIFSAFDVEVSKIGRGRVGKECRSRWSPYH